MNDNLSRIEVIWGHRLLDDGFTAIPNILIRNYRKLGISHGEWGLICTLLTYKHDERSPYPSQETLSNHLDVSTRQIKKWVESLAAKNLLLVGQRRNNKSKQFGSAVYNFNPLIQAALQLVGEAPLPESKFEWDIEYRNPSVLEVHTDPGEPKVPTVSEPQVHTDPVPEVPTNRIKQKTDHEYNNKELVVLEQQIANILGASVESLIPILPKWVSIYGQDYLVNQALSVARKNWDNVVGAYRASVETGWTLKETAAASTQRDKRYDAFYELFPDA